MSTIVYTATDAGFADGQPAKGTDVTSRTNQLLTWLTGNNLDPTDNIKVSVAYPWTARHSWTVADANNDNLALTVSSVMAANKYGFHILSSAAQINSAMQYVALSNASSTVACYEANNAGTGATFKATTSGDGNSFSATNSSSGGSSNCYQASQSGTGNLMGGSLRSLASLGTVLLAKKQTTVYTVNNSNTETVDTDLTVTLPANFLKAGTTIRGQAYGVISTPGSGPATARLRVKYGGTGGTTVLDSGAITPTVSLTNAPVSIDFIVTCLTTGGSGTVEAQGIARMNPSAAISDTIGPAARGLSVASGGAGNAVTFTIDTTTQNDLVLTFTWGSAVSGCTFSFRAGTVEILP